MKTKGFTLIELLVVISIIALLSSVVLASLGAARDKARTARVQADVRSIYTAFLSTIADGGAQYLQVSDGSGQVNRWYPHDCSTPVNVDTGDDRPNGQYLDHFASQISAYLPSMPRDPWGNRYMIDASYQCSTGEPGCVAGGWYYVIGSGGPDGSGLNIYDSNNVVMFYCRHS